MYIPEDMMLKHGINAKILTDRRISAILNDPEIEKGLSAASKHTLLIQPFLFFPMITSNYIILSFYFTVFDVACQAKGHLDEAR